MKSLSKNPLVWFIAAILLGWWSTRGGEFEFFAVVMLSIILAKQIEILNKKES